MKNKNYEILLELKTIAPTLVELENKTPFKVSPHYFEHLSNQIVEKINLNEEITIIPLSPLPYSIDANYFINLPGTVMQKIYENVEKAEVFEELENISPVLNTINKNMVYTVPAGYFKTALKTAPVDKAKIIISPSINTAVNYLAAAVIIGLLMIGIFLFTGNQNEDYKENTVKAVVEVKKLSEDDILNFLKKTSPADNIVISTNSKREEHIKNSLQNISDIEIKQFLQENEDTIEL